jgi:hypothetical protein
LCLEVIQFYSQPLISTALTSQSVTVKEFKPDDTILNDETTTSAAIQP